MKPANFEKANAVEAQGAGLIRGAGMFEGADAHGEYFVQCFDADGNLKWEDSIHNAVCSEGKNGMLTAGLKGSSFTAVAYMGLIEATGYGYAGANGSGVAATNLAAGITAAAGASPANGWNEAPSSVCAARGTPSFGTPSGGSVSLSSALPFSIVGSATIKGAFLLIKSAAGVAPTSAPGNTNGAIWSAGLFTNGDKTVGNGDTINVTYTTGL